MGEIADALRRAHAERLKRGEQQPPRSKPKGDTPADSARDVYSQSAKRHEEERAEDAPAPSQVGSRGPSSPASPPTERRRSGRRGDPQNQRDWLAADAFELTSDAEEARVVQGVLLDEGGAITDACLQMALRARKALTSQNARTLMIASALRNEGKTTVSCNLALAVASLGQVERVALVDLDLRRPSLASVLQLPAPRCGIEDVIVGGEPLEAARVPIASPPIDVFPCLRGQAKAHEILLLPAFAEALEMLRERYEVVILDSPPALLVPDATIIMQHADCFAPIARAGVTRARRFRKMLEMLPQRRLLGAILDGGSPASQKGYYDHYAADADADPSEPEEKVNDDV